MFFFGKYTNLVLKRFEERVVVRGILLLRIHLALCNDSDHGEQQNGEPDSSSFRKKALQPTLPLHEVGRLLESVIDFLLHGLKHVSFDVFLKKEKSGEGIQTTQRDIQRCRRFRCSREERFEVLGPDPRLEGRCSIRGRYAHMISARYLLCVGFFLYCARWRCMKLCRFSLQVFPPTTPFGRGRSLIFCTVPASSYSLMNPLEDLAVTLTSL